MTQWHLKTKTKNSGGKLGARRRRDKRLAERGGNFTATKIGARDQREHSATRGAIEKERLKLSKHVVVNDPSTGKAVKGELVSVAENTANRQYTRQNILTRGAVVKVQLGGKESYARITSRPGQDGVLQAVSTKKPVETKKIKKTAKESQPKSIRAEKAAEVEKTKTASTQKDAPIEIPLKEQETAKPEQIP